MPEKKRDEMCVGCVAGARERAHDEGDGVVVANHCAVVDMKSNRQHGRTFFGSALIAKRARRTDCQLEQQLQCELQLSRRA